MLSGRWCAADSVRCKQSHTNSATNDNDGRRLRRRRRRRRHHATNKSTQKKTKMQISERDRRKINRKKNEAKRFFFSRARATVFLFYFRIECLCCAATAKVLQFINDLHTENRLNRFFILSCAIISVGSFRCTHSLAHHRPRTRPLFTRSTQSLRSLYAPTDEHYKWWTVCVSVCVSL